MGLMILIMIAFFGNLCMNGVDDIDNDCILWEPVHEWG